jgi:hypothetical protein
VIQEEKSIFWGGDSIGHYEKKEVHVNVCLILNGYRDTAVWIYRPNSVRFFGWVGRKAKFAKERWIRKTNCSLAFWVLLPALRNMKINSRRRTRDLRTWVAKCIEADGGIFEYVLWIVTNLSFLCNKFVSSALNYNWNDIKSKLIVCHGMQWIFNSSVPNNTGLLNP